MALEFEKEYGSYKTFIYRPRKPRNSLVQKMGINDAPFITQPKIEGKSIRHPAYITWSNILTRCYSSKLKEKRPSYKEVTCCEEWLLFTNFAKWFKDNYIKGWQLDKDLLCKDNKIYSPKTCIFVPPEINTFIVLSGAARGIQPLGVDLHHGKFRAQIGGKDGVMKHLGYFDTPEQAHQVWQKAKLEQAIAFNFPPLQRVIDQLKFEIENNLETTSI